MGFSLQCRRDWVKRLPDSAFYHLSNVMSKNNQLIETNIMVSFNEIHGFYYEFGATLSANVCYWITAWTRSLAKSMSRNRFLGSINVYKYGLWSNPLTCGAVSVDSVFMIMLGSKKNSHNILSFIKSTLILSFIIKVIINLRIYRTIHCCRNPLLLTPILIKRVPNCIKVIKESEKHI